MKIRVKMNLVQKVKNSYPEFMLDTAEYPEIEGKTLDEIRLYIEKHSRNMHSTDGRPISLLDELSFNVDTYIIEDFPDESHFYVTAEDEESEALELY